MDAERHDSLRKVMKGYILPLAVQEVGGLILSLMKIADESNEKLRSQVSDETVDVRHLLGLAMAASLHEAVAGSMLATQSLDGEEVEEVERLVRERVGSLLSLASASFLAALGGDEDQAALVDKVSEELKKLLREIQGEAEDDDA